MNSPPKRETKILPRKSTLRVNPSNAEEYSPPSSSSRMGSNYDNNGSHSSGYSNDNSSINYTSNNNNSHHNNNSHSNNNNNNNSNSSRQNNPYPDNDSDYSRAADISGSDLVECENCNRKFNEKAHSKHVLICAKVNAKRKAFDSAKMRVEGNPELIQIMVKNNKEELKRKAQEARRGSGKPAGAGAGAGASGTGGPNTGGGQGAPVKRTDNGGGGGGGGGGLGSAESAAAAKKSKWLAESEAFRASMRAARQVTQAIASGAPLPPPIASAPDPSLVQCPHCSRRCVHVCM